MYKSTAKFLFFFSAVLLIIDLIFYGWEFDTGRIFRNISSACLIFLAIMSMRKQTKTNEN